MKQNKIFIYGKHAVAEALTQRPESVRKIHLASSMDDRSLRELIKRSGIPVEKIDERKVSSQAEGNASHQGVIALISLSGLVVPFEKFLDTFEPTPDTALVFLSEVQDPHNVGAVIRSAAAFGAKAVLFAEHNQASISGAVIKSSAGTAFTLPLVQVPGTQQALSALKKKGMMIYGLAGESSTTLWDTEFTKPSVFVLGNEAHGIASAAKSLCDTMLSIPMSSRAESLNVAAAGATVLYEWSTQHPDALQ
ncbi:MAG: 23S rRNA (guanosine(2251)-2'-O)-methyltransferase RlmB [Candidatus Pacebacteria bacterium]|nr:23S rRNA (guanosine(2251)-2'-O)-methyltransferase RlmB [Candidatus Paceibacterota bacterium]